MEKVSDEDVLKYLQDEEYMYANHILLMTMDPQTREALDDETKAQKKAQIDEIYEKIAAVKDDPEALVKLFKELKEEYCEDTGKTAYPDGYVFTPGTMVPEFENTVLSLGDYGLSEPVESDYGYHIILRLPLATDAVMGYNTDGSTFDARTTYVSAHYTQTISDELDALEMQFADGFAVPDLKEYVAE